MYEGLIGDNVNFDALVVYDESVRAYFSMMSSKVDKLAMTSSN